MAVEARHISIFPPQYIPTRECVKAKPNMNNARVDIAGVLATTTDATIDRQFSYGPPVVVDPVGVAASRACFNKSDSGLTYNVNPSPAPRKRKRESLVGDPTALLAAAAAVQKRRPTGVGTLIDVDMVSQIHQQQQSEIDRFVAQQTDKLRLEIEERQLKQTRMLSVAIQTAVAKKLKEKDEEIVRMGKLNWVLQERVKSLFVENQIWRDLAQTNEATANNLRTNLEQLLSQVDGGGEDHRPPAAAVEDDAESSCGSCSPADVVAGGENNVVIGDERRRTQAARGGCRRCGEREVSVLVLPCRHLCLCTVCGSALSRACPVCNTVMNASVHVNMS